MADAVETPGADAPPAKSDDAAKLQKEIDRLNIELEAERGRKADAVEDAKKEREKRRKEAEAKGEYDKAKAELEAKIAELQAQADTLPALTEKAKKADEIIEAERQALLARIPEDKRDSFKDDNADALKKALSLIPEEKQIPPTDKGKPAGRTNTDGLKWEQLSRDQKVKWLDEHSTTTDRDGSLALTERLKNERRPH